MKQSTTTITEGDWSYRVTVKPGPKRLLMEISAAPGERTVITGLSAFEDPAETANYIIRHSPGLRREQPDGPAEQDLPAH